MRCPVCGSVQIMVTDTRHLPAAIRRRRKCLDCDHRWTTLEISAETVLAGRAMMDEWDKNDVVDAEDIVNAPTIIEAEGEDNG